MNFLSVMAPLGAPEWRRCDFPGMHEYYSWCWKQEVLVNFLSVMAPLGAPEWRRCDFPVRVLQYHFGWLQVMNFLE